MKKLFTFLTILAFTANVSAQQTSAALNAASKTQTATDATQDDVINALFKGEGLFHDFNPADEATELRSANSKHFKNPDGTYTAVVGAGDLHYNENGKWKEILSHVFTNKTQEYTNYKYAAVHNLHKMYFPEHPGNPIVTKIENQVYEDWGQPAMVWLDINSNVLSEVLPDATSQAVIAKDSLTYSNIFPSVDAILINSVRTKKLSYLINDPAILINKPAGAVYLAFRETIKADKSWKLKGTESDEKVFASLSGGKLMQDIKFLNGASKLAVEIKTPLYYEYQAQPNRDEIWTPDPTDYYNGLYFVKENNSAYDTYTLIPVSWLVDTNRTFPLMIDPITDFYPGGTWPTYAVFRSANSGAWVCNTGAYGNRVYPNSDISYGWIDDDWPTDNPYLDGYATYNVSAIPDNSCINSVSYNWYRYGGRTCGSAITLKFGNAQFNANLAEEPSCDITGQRIRNNNAYYNGTGKNGTGWQNQPSTATTIANLVSALPSNNITMGWGYNGGDDCCTSCCFGTIQCTGDDGDYHNVYGYEHSTLKPYVRIDYYIPSIIASSASVGTNPTCPNQSVTLTVSGGLLGTGANWYWYSGSCGGTFAGSGSSISVSPASTTTYYVRAEGSCNTTGCVSVTVNVTNTASVAPTGAAGTTTICSGSSTTLTVAGGTPGTGAVAQWFTGSCGGASAGTGNSITVSPSSTTTYYVRYSGTCNVTSCASVTVTVNTLSVAPTGVSGTTTICSGSSTTLTVTGGTQGSGVTTQWFTGSCGGTSAGTGNSITVSPTSTTTYYVRYSGTCNTTGCTSVTVNVNQPSVPATGISGTTTVCNGTSTTLSVVGGSLGAGASWQWYSGSCGGASAGSGTSITVTPGSTTSYFVNATGTCNTTVCQSVAVNVNPLPNGNIVGTTSICTGQSTNITFNFTAGTGPFNVVYFNGTSNFNLNGISSGHTVSVSPILPTTYSLVSITDANTCQRTTGLGSSATITVNPLPTVSFPPFGPYCVSEGAVSLTPLGSPAGGLFSGPGVTGAQGSQTFVPSSAGAGTHTLTYTYTNGNNCTNSATRAVTVTALPVVTFAAPAGGPYCANQTAPVLLTGTPSGGTFSGTGVSGNTFIPANAAVGNNILTYTYTDVNGCTNTATRTLVVTGLPLVTFSGLSTSYCIDQTTSVLLTGNQSGGTFSGAGITDLGNGTANFTPSVAGAGLHTISFTFTDGNTCTNSQTQMVQVVALPIIAFSGLDAEYCVDAGSSTLIGSHNPDGSFTGAGITDNGNGTATFNPASAGVGGAYAITYSYSDIYGCSSSISQNTLVNDTPTVSFTGLHDVCVDQPELPLTGTPAGGLFSGTGISGNSFYPSISGLGVFAVTYTYSDGNGCEGMYADSLRVYDIPQVTQQPQDVQVCPGDAAAFSVTAVGLGLTYQWMVNDGNGFVVLNNGGIYSGATTNILSISAVPPSLDGYQFNCIVTGATCSTSTSSTTVTITENPSPTINTQPADYASCVGDNAVFNVTASGTSLTYQWQVNTGGGFVNLTNGGVYSGATTNTLNITGFTAGMDGYLYQCVVTGTINCTYSSTSNAALLSLTTSPNITLQPVTQSICEGDNAVFTTTATGTGLTYQWQENTGSGFVNVTNGGAYSGATSATLTVAGVTSAMDGYQYQAVISGSICVNSSTTNTVLINITTSPAIVQQPVDAYVCPTDPASFTIATQGTGITYQWQVNNGSGFVNVINSGVYSGATAATLNLSSVLSNMDGFQYRCLVNGIFCSGTSTSQVGTVHINGTPLITLQPADMNYCVGDNATFTVSANGTGLTYQWQVNNGSGWVDLVNGINYNGTNSTALTVVAAPLSFDGNLYRVIVSGSINCSGTTTSNPALLNEDPNPFISSQPVDQYVCPGDNAAFSVTASGSGLTYQWQENTGSGFVNVTNGGVYSGATTSTLNITGANPGMDGYTYQCVINGSICTGASITNVVTLHGTTSPYISVQPQDQSVCIGDNLIMSVTANGSGLTYQWQVNTGSGFVNVTDGGVYSGANASSLIISGATLGMNSYQYQVIINGTSCPDASTSNAVTLYVGQSPMIITDPATTAICDGFDASFSVTTLGNNLTYQWQVNTGSGFNDISNGGVYSNATTTTLNITGAGVSMNGYQYQVVVTGSINCSLTSTSASAVLTVNPLPVVSITGLLTQYCVNAPDVALTGVPSGGTFSGTGVSGTTFSPATAGVGGPYPVLYEYTDVNGCYNSSTISVTVVAQPVVSFSGLAGPYCINDNTPVALTGSPSGGTFSGTGVTGNTFVPSIAQLGNNSVTYTYTNLNGCTNSVTQVAVVNSLPVISFSGLNGPYCVDNTTPVVLTGSNAPNGTFTASGAGLTDNGNGTAGFVPSVAGAGSHTVTYSYSDVNGCTNTTTQTVVVNALPSVTFSGLANQQCITGSVVTLTGFPAGGTFSGPGITGNAFDPLAAGLGTHTIVYQYTDVVTGCSNLVSQNTIVYDTPVANAGAGGDACGLTFALAAAPSVGIGTWTVTGPGTATYSPNANDANATATVSAYGTYSFTWTEDNNGCADNASVNVNFYEQPVVSAGQGGNECDLDFTFSGSTSFGTGAWTASGPGTAFFTSTTSPTPSVVVSVSGVYTFTYTVANGTCSVSDQVTVDFNVLPVANAGQDGSECDLDVVLNAVPTIGTGTWSQLSGPGISTFSPNANDPAATATVTATGTYTYQWLEDHNGCTSSDVVSVVFHAAPIVTTTPSGTTAFCVGGSVLVSASSGFVSYLWSNGIGTQDFLASQTGQYTVDVVDVFGCTGTSAPLTVNVNALPVVDLGNDTTICTGNSVTLDAGNFVSYLWNTNGSTNQTLVAASNGAYMVTVTDVNGCVGSDQVSVTVAALLQPTVTSSSNNNTFCVGGSLTLDAGPGYVSYQWSDGITTTQTMTATQSGFFSVFVTDNSGCTGASTPVSITTIPGPTPVILSDGPLAFCAGNSVTLHAGFGYADYDWYPGNELTEAITVNQAGSYAVTVEDANGCTGTTDTVEVIVYPIPNPVLQANGPLQFCQGDSVVLSVLGSYASYLWTSGSTTPEIFVTENGQYGVTVMDLNGCIDSSLVVNPVTVTVWNPQPSILESGDSLICTPAFSSYQWYFNNTLIAGANGQVHVALESGNYSVEATDNNGCTGESALIEHSMVGINDIAINANISIYPNPTSGVFTFNALFDGYENLRLELTNALGQLIIPVEDVKDVMTVKRDYNLNHLPDGMYMLTIRTDKGSVTKRIVKN
jgi:hypothetical protein